MGHSVHRLYVRTRPGTRTQGVLSGPGFSLPVSLGRGGVRADKREGDGGTPRGVFRLVRLWWRADRHARPHTMLPARAIRPEDAWIEDPADRRYNRHVRRAPGEPGDRLKRDDHLYDFVIEIDHNTRPRIAKRGSAVFIHAARQGFKPTAGCVGLELKTLKRLLERLGPRTRIEIS